MTTTVDTVTTERDSDIMSCGHPRSARRWTEWPDVPPPGEVTTVYCSACVEEAEAQARCAKCGKPWVECEGIRADGELGCTPPRCTKCRSLLLSTYRANNGDVHTYCRRCGEVQRD